MTRQTNSLAPRAKAVLRFAYLCQLCMWWIFAGERAARHPRARPAANEAPLKPDGRKAATRSGEAQDCLSPGGKSEPSRNNAEVAPPPLLPGPTRQDREGSLAEVEVPGGATPLPSDKEWVTHAPQLELAMSHVCGNDHRMAANTPIPETPDDGELFLAIIGPDKERRTAVADAIAANQGESEAQDSQQARRSAAPRDERSAPTDAKRGLSGKKIVIREFLSYPNLSEDLPQMLGEQFDVIILDLDSDPDFALDLVERIYTSGPGTVMVYSARTDRELLIRSMRAGAREFLTLPLDMHELTGALARVSVRRPPGRSLARSAGSLIVFLGVKGGCGVTTLASNFALSVAQESNKSTLLVDLGLPLGDVAINLGMTPQYSTANAFQEYSRLDGSFLSGLLEKHSSGLCILSAPREFVQVNTPNEAIDKLIAVARQNFDYVVVDAGSRVDLHDTVLFEEFASTYLVVQVGVSELRNANRLISQFFPARGRNLQIVINRYSPNALLFDETHITKALTQPAQWRIPDDFATARRTQNTAIPIALGDSPISRVLRQMARTACGLPAFPEKRKGFSIFG